MNMANTIATKKRPAECDTPRLNNAIIKCLNLSNKPTNGRELPWVHHFTRSQP